MFCLMQQLSFGIFYYLHQDLIKKESNNKKLQKKAKNHKMKSSIEKLQWWYVRQSVLKHLRWGIPISYVDTLLPYCHVSLLVIALFNFVVINFLSEDYFPLFTYAVDFDGAFLVTKVIIVYVLFFALIPWECFCVSVTALGILCEALDHCEHPSSVCGMYNKPKTRE
ncbi:hypothetical protein RFI_08551 [Reticulomyxa filosa]|uniref:Uncharacterized protein n=1 Tax=Reticulomyxa filosa TaxID=46433 RepID=X6NTE4_RETFI|nr:hypothetical protein RFI_08551 [Reticulomyxa filosa]|eukprot:ETO28577.1 hypothetical protein RFI_08551 [Reticulomyxa filosa]